MNKRTTISVMWKLLALVKPLAGWMCVAVITGVLGFLCAGFITVLGGYGLLNGIGIQTVLSYKNIFVCMAVFAVLRGVLHYIEHACNHYIAFKLLALLRDKVFKVLRTLAPAKLDGVDKGDLIALVTSDIELLEIFFAHTISPICIAIIMVAVMTGFIGQFHFVLGFIAFIAYIVVGVILPMIMSKMTKKLGEEKRKDFAEMNTYVLDSMRGIKEIKQYNYGQERLDFIENQTETMEETSAKLKDSMGLTFGITNSCVLGFSILVFLVSLQMYSNGAIAIDGVIIPTLALFSSFGPVIALANLGSGLAQTIACGNRLLDILEESPAVEEVLDGQTPEMNSLSLENVDFAYTGEEILKAMNLEISPGKITGLTGKSGSGKSTILKLLMRFWDVNDGMVSVDGADIKNVDTKHLRMNQSLVTQDTHLFHDTIEANIRLANLEASLEEVIAASKKASLHEFVMSLPNGYETQVGELGDTLSGGERQRIGLARAFLHNAKCLFLDEPTSNLDSLNEAVILKALREDTDRTILLVSHRASTMKVADVTVNLESNRVS